VTQENAEIGFGHAAERLVGPFDQADGGVVEIFTKSRIEEFLG